MMKMTLGHHKSHPIVEEEEGRGEEGGKGRRGWEDWWERVYGNGRGRKESDKERVGECE